MGSDPGGVMSSLARRRAMSVDALRACACDGVLCELSLRSGTRGSALLGVPVPDGTSVF
jgi:hypothetical protein